MTLDDLPAAYQDARVSAVTHARYTSESCPSSTCRYCGRFWQKWPLNTTNEGHARCTVTPGFIAALGELWWRSPVLTRDAIAKACGVTVGVVHAWTNPRRIGRAA